MATIRNYKDRRQEARNQQTTPEQPQELIPPTTPPAGWKRWAPLLAIVLLVLIVFAPSVDNDFVSWDDDHYLFDNHQVHYDDGIKSIWFDVFTHAEKKFLRPNAERGRVSHQYYPLVFTLYWIEFRFHVWFNDADPNKTIRQNIDDGKMTAASFHMVSIVLHALNCILLIWCFRALGMSNWIAWAAVILFAIHPMQVASVAWAAERKNIISLMFYILSLMTYIKLRREGKWWQYLLSLVLFQAALFSKTVSLTLPIMLFFTDRLLERSWSFTSVRRSLVRVVPFLILSCIAAGTTIKVEDRQRSIPLTEAQRPFIPCASLLFYPSKMLLPTDLSPVYRLWQPDPQSLVWSLPILITLALGGLIIWFRKRLGPHFIWALFMYGVTMCPMLGFKNINYFQFAFVADHYFYHGAVGLFVLLVICIDKLRVRFINTEQGINITTGIVCALALLWGIQTAGYCNVWQDAETFWARTIEKNDTCWPAYFNTANARAKSAQQEKDPKERERLFDEAAERYARVAEIQTQITQPFVQILRIRSAQRKWPELLEASTLAVRRFPHIADFHGFMAVAYENLGDKDKAVERYVSASKMAANKANSDARQGRFCSAVGEYNKAGSFLQKAYKLKKGDETIAQTLKNLTEKITVAREKCKAGK